MAQAVNMKVPLQVRMAAALAGVQAKDFAVGWANGLVRWKMRRTDDVASRISPELFGVSPNPFEGGSVKWAASEAAVTFMRAVRK